MIKHVDIPVVDLRKLVKQKEINFGGNIKLKIFGTLQCASGKRMKRVNRVFFASVEEAVELGFRPCGHCMKTEYKKWKNGTI